MSLDATRSAWKARNLSAPERLVLLCLADAADGRGVAWPSVADICERTELGKSAVYTALRVLRAAGLISSEWNPGDREHPVFPPSGFRNTESGIRKADGGQKIPPRGNEIPPDGIACKESESTRESTSNRPGGSGGPKAPADQQAAMKAIEVLRDTWPEFKRRAFRALGIDEKAERGLEAAGRLLLPQPHHTDLVAKWRDLHELGNTAEDLLLLADWLAAGAFANLRYDRPGCLVRALGQYLSDARIWQEAGRPAFGARGKPAPPQAAGLRGDDTDHAADKTARKAALQNLLGKDGQ